MMVAHNVIHPELRKAAVVRPGEWIGPRTLRPMRALTALIPSARDVEVVRLGGRSGLRLFRPVNRISPVPALLWIHGGGYVMGRAKQDDWLCPRFVRRLGIAVASAEYRLAPEHPYPAGLEDCYTALTWLARQPWVDADRIAIGGASAGAGLAAALAFLARDRGELRPALQSLTYPMLDDRTVGVAGRRYPMWTPRNNRFAWDAYLSDADRETAVPARRTDLSGLPRAWIGIGTLDLFFEEDLAYAERLRNAGVRCDVQVAEGAFHGFDGLAQRASVSRAFFDSQCASLRAALTPSEPGGAESR